MLSEFIKATGFKTTFNNLIVEFKKGSFTNIITLTNQKTKHISEIEMRLESEEIYSLKQWVENSNQFSLIVWSLLGFSIGLWSIDENEYTQIENNIDHLFTFNTKYQLESLRVFSLVKRIDKVDFNCEYF